jgi:hypothetical protein
MSYDICLKDVVTGETLKADSVHQIAGGTYALGGTQYLELNITYNYAGIINRVLPGGIRGLHGKLAVDTIPELTSAISQLSNDVDDNYWTATEGNVKRALNGLLALAKIRPDGAWYVS